MPDVKYRYVYGPVPSRRLGQSLGISPIPQKTCNYSCIFCQLGRTNNLTNQRQSFFDLQGIIEEFKRFQSEGIDYDVVTIVGEGEPTLYLELGALIRQLQQLTDKPIAVITNGALLCDPDVRQELMAADIVLPSLDASDEESFKKINRSHGNLNFNEIIEGLRLFSHAYPGQIWIETMLVKGMNDSAESVAGIKAILNTLRYDRLYINTPVRPPAEDYAKEPDHETLLMAVSLLGGIAMDLLAAGKFFSPDPDDVAAVKWIIRRHPMNQHEIQEFLKSRKSGATDDVLERLEKDPEVQVITYKGYVTYRLKV